MKARNENKMPLVNRNINFDALSQEFDGGSFYGLEYVLEDFLQNTIVKPTAPVRPAIDWFGLYN
jgi:hypothetical protein